LHSNNPGTTERHALLPPHNAGADVYVSTLSIGRVSSMVDVRITSIGVRNHRDKDKESDVNHSYSASSQTMHQINHKKGTTMKSSVAILIGLAGMLCLVIPATAMLPELLQEQSSRTSRR